MTEESELRVDPNTADSESLVQLPGIGPELAKRIVDGRPFESLEDLQRVPGLGDNTLAQTQIPITSYVNEPSLEVDNMWQPG